MVALALRLLLDVRWASLAAACFSGDCSLADRLVAIARRESNLELVSIHEQDRRWSRTAWRNAVRAGYLDPRCQPYHGGWSTRGSFGTFAAYTVHHLGSCMPAWVLDLPLFGALAAVRRMRSRACGGSARCRSWRGKGEAA